MNRIKIFLWKHLKPLQWRILWLAHDKFMIGVRGVILDDKKQVLLFKHTYWKDGSWGLPGGYIQKNEKIEDALIREVYEETKYKVKIDRLIQMTSGYKLRVDFAFLGHITGGKLHLDTKEILEAKFFPLNKLPEELLESQKKFIEIAKISSR